MQISYRSPSKSPNVIVLGIGNTLMCDDGVGIHVIHELQRGEKGRPTPRENIQFLDGGTLGYLLIDRVSDADGLIIVDSANLGAAPGTVRVIDGDEVDRYLADNPSSSVHEVGLIDLLQMLTLNREAPRLRALVGVQPESMGWGTEMTPAVSASVPAASAAVTKILEGWIGRVESCPS
jgi:hydrogenase maturation protease